MSRQVIIETINAAVLAVLDNFGSVDSFTESGPQPDFASQARPWVLFGVEVEQMDRIGMSSAGQGPYRRRGALQLAVFEKAGTGTAVSAAVLDALDAVFVGRNLSGVIMGGARPFKPLQFGQWNPSGVQYLFTFDEVH